MIVKIIKKASNYYQDMILVISIEKSIRDSIFGFDATDAAAILGNHDQESILSREGVMKHIVGLKNTVSQVNPVGKIIEGSVAHVIDGFGNYNLEVGGVEGSGFVNKSILNLLLPPWFPPSMAMKEYAAKPEAQKGPAPGLAYFHIPLPEFASFDSSNFTGDVKAVFTGHDHLNDFCGELTGIQLCFAGGFGYHAYGKAGWARKARVVAVNLEKTERVVGEQSSQSKQGSALMISISLPLMVKSSGARALRVKFTKVV
ncbi:probable inactive purple acid phosphatase 29 isoform X4 [Fagus crenata]